MATRKDCKFPLKIFKREVCVLSAILRIDNVQNRYCKFLKMYSITKWGDFYIHTG